MIITNNNERMKIINKEKILNHAIKIEFST